MIDITLRQSLLLLHIEEDQIVSGCRQVERFLCRLIIDFCDRKFPFQHFLKEMPHGELFVLAHLIRKLCLIILLLLFTFDLLSDLLQNRPDTRAGNRF